MNNAARLAREIIRVGRILGPRDFLRWLNLLVRHTRTVCRSGSLGVVDQAYGPQVRFRCGGRWLVVEGGALGVAREIAGANCYVQPGELAGAKHILDFGANCGVFSLFALASATRARVFAVEAEPDIARVANANIVRNGFAERFEISNAYAGGRNAFIDRLLTENPEIRRFDPDGYIDSVGVCDFVKCDIEGSEFALFTPASRWVRNVRRIALEYHGPWSAGKELKCVLESHGFRVNQRSHGSLGYLDGVQT